MIYDGLKEKIHNTLKSSFNGLDYYVNVFDDTDERVRILVISRKFDIHNYNISDREEMIWSEINRVLSEEEIQQISRIVAINPEEIKIYT